MSRPIITREQFPFWTTVEVRWGDMDAMGHVNNTVYFTYLESARIELLKAIGGRRKDEDSATGPTLVSTSCDYRREVRFPARLDIGVRVTGISQRSFTLEYGLFFHGTDDLAALGRSVNAWVDYSAKKAIPLPDDLRLALNQYASA